MVATSQREVVFLLKTQLDPSIASGFSDVAQRARKSQEEIFKGMQQQRDSEATASRDRVRDAEQEQAKLSKVQKQQAAQDERERKEAVRAGQAAAKERTRIEKEAARDAAKAQKEWEQQAIASYKQVAAEQQKAAEQRTQAERAAQQTSVQFSHALVQMAAARSGILLSSLHMARGVALLMGSGKKEAHELLENLMFVHGAYDLFRGASHIVHSLEAAHHSYNAAVAASEALQKASAVAATEAAQAHMADAAAASVDAAANSKLADAASASAIAQKAAGISGFAGLFGRGLNAGAGLLRGIGGLVGGGVAAGVGVVGGVAAGVYGGYKLGTMGPEAAARRSDEHIAYIEALRESQEKASESSGRHQSEIERVQTEYRAARHHQDQGLFDTDMASKAHAREVRGPRIGETTRDWSTNRQGIRSGMKREATSEDYRKLVNEIEGDRYVGRRETAEYQAKASEAADKVKAAQKAEAAAEAVAAERRQAAATDLSFATREERKAESGGFEWYGAKRNKTVGAAYWAERKIYGMFGGDSRSESEVLGIKDTDTQQSLQEKASSAHDDAIRTAQAAGKAEEELKARHHETEEAIKQQEEAVKKAGETAQRNIEKEIKLREEVISKLREEYEGHMHNAEAIEKGGRALAIQMALEKPEQRHKLTRAMKRYQAGHASDKQIALLAEHASPERKEELEKELEKRQRGKYDTLREFEGWGRGAADVEKKKADEAKKVLDEQKQAVEAAREAGVSAANKTANKLAEVIKELFRAQADAFEKEIGELSSKIDQLPGMKPHAE